jgi:uncharacterized protein (TIGR00290 family)
VTGHPGRPIGWLSWSSGKDSAWALHVLRSAGAAADAVQVTGLLTTVVAGTRAVSMHGVPHELLQSQADAVGLPLHVVELPWPCPNEEYARRMGAAMAGARAAGVSRMVFGDLFMADVRSYREQQLAGTGIEPLFPLWSRPTGELAREMVSGGLSAVLACVDSRQAPRELAGRPFDAGLLADLPPGVDPCGENGEFHTFVTDAPCFTAPVPVTVGAAAEQDGFVRVDLAPAGG